jgi:hypothetical protein
VDDHPAMRARLAAGRASSEFVDKKNPRSTIRPQSGKGHRFDTVIRTWTADPSVARRRSNDNEAETPRMPIHGQVLPIKVTGKIAAQITKAWGATLTPIDRAAVAASTNQPIGCFSQ